MQMGSWQQFIDENRETLFEVPGIFEVSGWVQGVCAPQCTGGATLETNSGKRTAFREVSFNREPGAAGTLRTTDGSVVDRGTVLMTARREGDGPGNQLTATGNVSNTGRFFVFMAGLEEGMVVQLFYLGGFGFAPSETEYLRVKF